MKARKYKESYRLVDEGGHLGQRRAEYVGEYYSFPEGTPAGRQRALRGAAWVALYWLATLLYLRTGRATGRCMYALIPVLIGLLPGVYAALGVATTARAPERMTLVQREDGPGRLVRAALGCAAFSAAGCIGCIVRVSIDGLWASAWHEPLLTATACAGAFAAFSGGRKDYRELAVLRDG